MSSMDTAGMPENQEVKPKGKKGKKPQPAQGATMDQPQTEGTAATEAAPKAPRPRVSKNFPVYATIKVLSEKNPKRPTSKAYSRFEFYKTGMTVGEFIKAGGTYGDLAWDLNRKYIEVEGVVADAPAEPTPVQ